MLYTTLNNILALSLYCSLKFKGESGLNRFQALIIRIIFIFLSIGLISGCTTDYPNREPLGEIFPSISGESLEQNAITFPAHVTGKNVVLMLGYVQNSQFDIDRWLIGLDMTKTQVDVYELPAIQGMFPRFFKTQIDNGMRKGIPKELWKGVVTIYGDGDRVQEFTGNINPNNARVILLDKSSEIKFFYDRGFSVNAMNSLKKTLEEISDD
jgi:hypothetical protein